MVNDSFSHEVMATLMTFIYGLKQKHHVFVKLASGVPLAYLVDSFDDDLVDYFAGVSADQGYPLVDKVPFLSKLNFDCLDHFDSSHNIMESGLLRLLTTELIHQNERLDVPFELSCHIQASSDELGSLIQEFSVLCHILVWNLNVHHDI